MSNIAMVKKPDLVRGQVIEVLQERLPARMVTCYCDQSIHLIYETITKPDLLIIDLNTEVDLVKLINYHLEKGIKVVVWSSRVDKTYLNKYFKLGLHGYFYNEMETRELIFAIRSILDGGYYIHPSLSHVLLDDYVRFTNKKPNRPEELLTNREWEVLELIVKGNRNNCIGEKLFISSKTVTNHVAAILRKLHVTDRINAALIAVKKGWFIL